MVIKKAVNTVSFCGRPSTNKLGTMNSAVMRIARSQGLNKNSIVCEQCTDDMSEEAEETNPDEFYESKRNLDICKKIKESLVVSSPSAMREETAPTYSLDKFGKSDDGEYEEWFEGWDV